MKYILPIAGAADTASLTRTLIYAEFPRSKPYTVLYAFRCLDEAMAKSARYLPLDESAKVLGVTTEVVLQMAAEGRIQTQKNGSITEFRFNFDPKAKTKYTPVPASDADTDG